MKVLHICLASFYIDGGSYQENILPRYHKKMGCEVEIVASPDIFDDSGRLIISAAPRVYLNNDGIKVSRIPYVCQCIDFKLKRFKGLSEILADSSPDILFIHGCQFLDIFKVIKYILKNPQVRVFVDNHADFSNSAKSFVSKFILHRVLWRYCARSIANYVEKFYGVLPSRVDFLNNEYQIPLNKIELLVMGADDDYVDVPRSEVLSLRTKLGIAPDDFLIVTGGKIDSAKLEVLDLMRVVPNLPSNVKLVVFGSVVPEIKESFDRLVNDKVLYVGWLNSEATFPYFAMADLVVFPGRHSVFWEQVVAQAKPMVVKQWPGTTHIDIGGNVKFLNLSTPEEIEILLSFIISNEVSYFEMVKSANSPLRENFLYSRIALQSLQII